MKQFNRPFFRVAVIYCKGVFYHTHAHYGFCKAIKKKSRGRIVIEDHLATNLSVSQMSKQARKAVGSNPDMIVAIGRMAVRSVISYQTEKGTKVPTVAVGAEDLPTYLNDHVKQFVTGVATDSGYPLRQAELICYLKKDLKRIAVPFVEASDTQRMSDQINTMKKYLEIRGVDLVGIKSGDLISCLKALSEMIRTVDAVIILEGSTASRASKKLGKLCSQHGVVLFAASLDAVEKDAALGIGIDPRITGSEAANLVVRVIIYSESIGALPFTLLKEIRRLLVNREVCQKQGLALFKEEDFLIEFGGFASCIGEKV